MDTETDVQPKQEIENWWATFPMTYGNVHGTSQYGAHRIEAPSLGSRAFFEQVDKIFYSWNKPLHTDAGYFAQIFPYEQYQGKQVLEIGCGMGTMAMNWVQHGARVTAVDLNATSIAQTTRRFELLGLQGRIQQADGNVLPFEDASFDYVYSWGVLHHSPDLDRSIREFLRVLKPGGGFGIMLYNRRSILYGYRIKYIEGFLHGESNFLNALQLASRYTDASDEEGNPHTWPVTEKEMTDMFAPSSRDLRFQRLGTELDNMLGQMMPLPGVSRLVPRIAKKVWARRLGWSLWADGVKR